MSATLRSMLSLRISVCGNGVCGLFSPFKFRVLPTHDASKVRASGPGLTSGVPASFPVEFSIDAKDAGQGQLSVLITVSDTHKHTIPIIHTKKRRHRTSTFVLLSSFLFLPSFLFRTRMVNLSSPVSLTMVTVHTRCLISLTVRAGTT